jgi:hypothetical protein
MHGQCLVKGFMSKGGWRKRVRGRKGFGNGGTSREKEEDDGKSHEPVHYIGLEDCVVHSIQLAWMSYSRRLKNSAVPAPELPAFVAEATSAE